MKIACPEEVAYLLGLMSADQVRREAERLKKSTYGEYLLRVLEHSPGVMA